MESHAGRLQRTQIRFNDAQVATYLHSCGSVFDINVSRERRDVAWFLSSTPDIECALGGV